MTNPLTFEELRCGNVQRQIEWDPDGKITKLFSGLEFNGEVGELLELMLQLAAQSGKLSNSVKKLEREALGLKGSRVTFMQMAEEFADVQITLDLLAMHCNLDLGEATRLKFNSTSSKMTLRTRL
jgi:NTP pyrophosphatase (non-canonical NTP hydrolase)